MDCKEVKRANIQGSSKEGLCRPDDNVGLDALPEQIVHRAVQAGFSFNILCVGEPGIGKSTLLESLFAISLNTAKGEDALMDRGPKRLIPDDNGILRKQQYILTEGSVRLKLTTIETCGYGDQIDKSMCHQFITDYIDAQFNRTMNNELRLCQRNRRLEGVPCEDDSCVHVCLYFIEPTGHSIKTLDLVTLNHLDSRVNIVPIIAKADTLSKTELAQMKENVIRELSAVQLYQWPTADKGLAAENQSMNEMMPFAVVGSSQFIRVANKSVRGRQYPWGVVQVENEHHCDFVRLRQMLIRTNMFDLIERTHSVHYEQYRLNRLRTLGISRCVDQSDEVGDTNHLAYFEKRRASLRQEHEQGEAELKGRFIERVKKKEVELRRMEREIHEELDGYKQWYKENRESLEQKRNQLNKEIAAFEAERKHSSRLVGAIGRKLKR